MADEVTRATAAEGVLTSDLADEVTRATDAEDALDVRVSDIEGNYLDKRTGGNVTGDINVTGTVTATGGLEINGGGGSTTLFVENGKVGVNTEAPAEALDVTGNANISGNLYVGGEIFDAIVDGGSF